MPSGWEYGGKKDLESKRKARARARAKGYKGQIHSDILYVTPPKKSSSGGGLCLMMTSLMLAAPTALVALSVKVARR